MRFRRWFTTSSSFNASLRRTPPVDKPTAVPPNNPPPPVKTDDGQDTGTFNLTQSGRWRFTETTMDNGEVLLKLEYQPDRTQDVFVPVHTFQGQLP